MPRDASAGSIRVRSICTSRKTLPLKNRTSRTVARGFCFSSDPFAAQKDQMEYAGCDETIQPKEATMKNSNRWGLGLVLIGVVACAAGCANPKMEDRLYAAAP